MLFTFFCTYDKIYPKNIHRYEREVHAFMDITMLGTGNAMVTECYNTCFVLRDGDKHLLVEIHCLHSLNMSDLTGWICARSS